MRLCIHDQHEATPCDPLRIPLELILLLQNLWRVAHTSTSELLACARSEQPNEGILLRPQRQLLEPQATGEVNPRDLCKLIRMTSGSCDRLSARMDWSDGKA